MFLCENVHLGSELALLIKSSVRLPGVVRFRSPVKGRVNIFDNIFFLPDVKNFSSSFIGKAMIFFTCMRSFAR